MCSVVISQITDTTLQFGEFRALLAVSSLLGMSSYFTQVSTGKQALFTLTPWSLSPKGTWLCLAVTLK